MKMDMKELERLLKQQEELNNKIAELQSQKRDEGIAEIKRIMGELGITASMLGFYDVTPVAPSRQKPERTFKGRRVFGPAEPKYRNPATGETWSGRGRQPRWMEGERDAYLIKTPDTVPSEPVPNEQA